MGVAQPTVVMPFAAPPTREEVAAAFPDLEVLEVLGQGGMGIVFKARQPRLDRLVALKILPPALAGQPGFPERFTREARALAKLNHPNIVTVHDFGTSGGFYYLLMEYVNGVNLRKAMKAGVKPEQAMLLVPRICEALQFAHDHGVLHRDIKPENILLDTTGTPKLADFGIAKMAGENAGGLTLSGAALGTAAYMAPEQIEKPATVDHRADIYSLGVVFYEMLTGELPLGRFASPSEKANVGESVDRVVLRALEKERDRRQQSATEMKTQVEGVHKSGPPPIPPQEEWRDTGMRQFLFMLSVLCAIGIPASAVIGLPFLKPQIMVFVTCAVAALAALWPGKSPHRRHRHAHHHHIPPGIPVAVPGQVFESRSRRVLFGLPLYHIVRGYNPATGVIPVARGIFAIGQVAKGFFAIGGRAHGVIAIGGFSTGIVTLGGITFGLFSLGGLAVGLLCAVGGMAVGSLVLGGGMVGLDYLGGQPVEHLFRGRMLLGPLVDPSGEIPQLLRRVAVFTGVFTAGLSVLMLFLTAFAREGNASPRNPWPGRLFAMIFLIIAIPAFALLLPKWQVRHAGMGSVAYLTRTGMSSDGPYSEALWEANAPEPLWMSVESGGGSQSIAFRDNGNGRYAARLSLKTTINNPQPDWMKVTWHAENDLRQMKDTTVFAMPLGLSAGRSFMPTQAYYPLTSSSGSRHCVLNAGPNSIWVTLSKQPLSPPEDKAVFELQNTAESFQPESGRLTLEYSEAARGDCMLYLRTVGALEPETKNLTKPYVGGYVEIHRAIWTLPKITETERLKGLQPVKKIFPGSAELIPGQEIKLFSLPREDGTLMEIFLGARHYSGRRPESTEKPVEKR
jgi:predicted Ser/Thr protein kinase